MMERKPKHPLMQLLSPLTT